MTAFGRSSLKTDNGELLCEIRSVNHRYLDVGLRLPENLRSAEAHIRERLAKAVGRGKVEVFLKPGERQSGGGTLAVNETLLQELTEAAGRVEAMTRSQCVIDAVRLLQWPGVISVSDAGDEVGSQAVRQVFELALVDFLGTREREGQQLGALLRQRNNQLAALVQQLREHRPGVLAQQREKLRARITALQTDHDEARLEQELVYAAQRLDIDEELDRLVAHTVELEAVLQRDEPVGRRLDFLMQEFNREANTISSKSADQQTTALAVDMKVLIEQMREQVQNVE
ncbi:YicC/YloC family endoribonuclease [Granulosicoccus sp. 3-233]|uniref:YicC/YloC family endoribonuclease n=1 Tax=Granulosicoccus sp. 3-233 TaxID=3417969 RepID=UPI003D34BDDB